MDYEPIILFDPNCRAPDCRSASSLGTYGALSVVFTASLRSNIISPFYKEPKLILREVMCSKSLTWKVTKPHVGPRPTLPNSKTCIHFLTHKYSGEVNRLRAQANPGNVFKLSVLIHKMTLNDL